MLRRRVQSTRIRKTTLASLSGMTGSTTDQAGASVPADTSPPPALSEVAMTGLDSREQRMKCGPLEAGGDDRDA